MRNLIPHCLERMIFGYKRIFTFINGLRIIRGHTALYSNLSQNILMCVRALASSSRA
jgi:hypothetical protein